MTKPEARINDEAGMTKLELIVRLPLQSLRFSAFGDWGLFRISDFGLRHSATHLPQDQLQQGAVTSRLCRQHA